MLLGSSPHFAFVFRRPNVLRKEWCTLPIPKKHHKLTQLWEDPNCDGFLVILTPQAMTAPTDCAVALTKYAKIQGSDDPTGPTSPGILPTLGRSDTNFFMFGFKKNSAYARPKQWWENYPNFTSHEGGFRVEGFQLPSKNGGTRYLWYPLVIWLWHNRYDTINAEDMGFGYPWYAASYQESGIDVPQWKRPENRSLIRQWS